MNIEMFLVSCDRGVITVVVFSTTVLLECHAGNGVYSNVIAKAVPLHATKGRGRRGGIAPTFLDLGSR
jgi:hypothetical protein